MNKVSRPYRPELLKALQDPAEAAEYLNAALEEGSNELFLLALRNVAEARGMKKLATEARLNRESMYRMLSEQGNPQLSSLSAVLHRPHLRTAFPLTEQQVRRLLRQLRLRARLTPHALALRVVEADREDDNILIAAVEGRADCIISGDKHLRDLGSYQDIPILSPAEFVEQYKIP